MAFDSAVSRRFRSGARALAGRLRALSRGDGNLAFALIATDIAPDQPGHQDNRRGQCQAQQHPADN